MKTLSSPSLAAALAAPIPQSEIRTPQSRTMSARRKKSLIRRILALQEKGRTIYERIHTLTEDLRHGVEVDREVIELDPVTRYQVIDNFAQPSAGKYTRINRFELKKLPNTKRPAKEPAASLEGERPREPIASTDDQLP